ncbi:MAG: integrase arm-type DNA-binding domain-containing protein [Rhizobiales bacterium]|nr:tyrosine-type recombinase/integrase [Hyphomicrobiales bacterium]NRB15116.1 integrase arm-type DNA-binding domain-containing protein [Hyphomicrobiales bacterium]
MAHKHILSQFKAKNLESGKYCDGQGLWLCKYNSSAGKWVLRLTVHSRRREMGLGPWPEVSIAEAREHAGNARRLLRTGVDPIVERAKQKIKRNSLTLAEVIKSCFIARQAELKNDGKAGRWMSPMKIHVIPKIGKVPIEEIDQHQICRAMKPIWHTKSDTAQKALSRLNLTLKHAAALGLDVDLQATMKAKALLGKQRHEKKHIPSLPYVDVPKFYEWICKQKTMTTLSLRMLILTAARSGEIRFAKMSEIENEIWTIPAERTKTNRIHRIPLTAECITVLKLAKSLSTGDYIFSSPIGEPLSDATMSRFMDRAGYVERPHGFRASFRTWVEEQTDTAYEVKESALGHVVGSSTERAYQRSDVLDKRRLLMNKWAGFVTN